MKNRSCSSSPTSSDDARSAIVLLASASSESEAPSAASARSSSDRRGSTRPRRLAPVTSMLIAVVDVPAASSIEPRSRWQLASSTGSSTSGSAASIKRAACGRSPVNHASDAASASRRPFSCGEGDRSAARSAAADAAVNAFRDRARPAACSSSRATSSSGSSVAAARCHAYRSISPASRSVSASARWTARRWANLAVP